MPRLPRPSLPALRLAPLVLAASAGVVSAQDNYEIQVYSYDTVPPSQTMVELHSNYTFRGSRTIVDGVVPSDHALHETLEITRGVTPWFEVGAYLFTDFKAGRGYSWVGDHLRPRVRAPEQWHWPVGASLSAEFGFQRRAFSADTWTLELRPVLDLKRGPVYFALNPTLDRAFKGPNAPRGFQFSPNAKASYDITAKVTAGVEYYGSLGPVTGFDPLRDQQHQIFPTLDLNLSPRWEINAGLGFGLTRSTDRLILKGIVGYRLPF